MQPSNSRPSSTLPRTAGTILVETLAACVVLAAVASLAVQSIAAHGRQQRELERRAAALANAASALEQVTALAFDEIAPAAAGRLKLADLFAALPGAKLTLEVANRDVPNPKPGDEQIRGKQITVDVEWSASSGPAQSVRLTTYVYERARNSP